MEKIVVPEVWYGLFWIGMGAVAAVVLYQVGWRAIRRGVRESRYR